MYYDDTRSCRTCHHFRYGKCIKELPLEDAFNVYRVAEEGFVSEAIVEAINESNKYLGKTLSILSDYVPKKKAEAILEELNSMFNFYTLNLTELVDEKVSTVYQNAFNESNDFRISDDEFYCKEWA